MNTQRTKEGRKVASREEWLSARRELLKAEKALTVQSDAVARARQQLPWVRVEKEYHLDTDTGKASLAELFRGRSQLLVYHFMFGPDYKAGCPSCSAIADGFNGFVVHLAHHDVMLWAVSRAPLQKLQAYEARMGWTFPWASSFESDFNNDYGVAFSEEQLRSGSVEHNYRAMETKSELRDEDVRAVYGTDRDTMLREAPGMSAFALEGGVVYHTYSAYIRGLDSLWGMYQWLDRTPRGRNEQMVQGMGNLHGSGWYRRHDEYGD